jgi:hypothetical protein
MEQNTTNRLIKVEQSTVEALNSCVADVLTNNQLQSFEKAFAMAGAIKELKSLMTAEVMEPIMQLQGSQLGFKTDKDKNGGYDIETVKNCVITATLMGVMPVGNQFNIISNSCYITKEGFEYLLNKIPNLRKSVTHDLPRIQGDKGAILMHIEWQIGNKEALKQSVEFPIKVNSFMGADAVIGKGKRKAYAWLYSQVTGLNYTDGDIDDVQKGRVVDTKIHSEYDRVKFLVETSKTLEDLQTIEDSCGDDLKEELSFEIDEKREQLKSNEATK